MLITNIKLWCCATVLTIVAIPQAVAASIPTIFINLNNNSAPQNQSLRNFVFLKPPSLPPLGNSSTYLPSEARYQDNSPVSNISLLIKLSDRRVYIYENAMLKASYPIAIGKEGWETPVGEYQVLHMQQNPAWEHPFTGEVIPPGDEENPLGTRWIGFWTDGDNFIGFHGTPDEASVGEATSHGCIRMYNQDILVLYALVDLGTPVIVKP